MPTIEYRVNGVRVPGVTTVIGTSLGWNKGALMHWAWTEGKEGRNYRDTQQSAADAGTLAHAMVEARIRKQDFVAPPTASPDDLRLAGLSFSAFEEWFTGTRVELIETEVHLVSEAYRFGGTPDAIGRMKGNVCLLDWKTSRGIYAEYLIQLAAYQHLWDMNRPKTPITGGIHCCRFDKSTGGFSHHWWPNEALIPAWKSFIRLRDLYDLERLMKKLAA